MKKTLITFLTCLVSLGAYAQNNYCEGVDSPVDHTPSVHVPSRADKYDLACEEAIQTLTDLEGKYSNNGTSFVGEAVVSRSELQRIPYSDDSENVIKDYRISLTIAEGVYTFIKPWPTTRGHACNCNKNNNVWQCPR